MFIVHVAVTLFQENKNTMKKKEGKIGRIRKVPVMEYLLYLKKKVEGTLHF
jgi:hypothetical protein